MAKSFEPIMLGEGKLYIDYGESGELEVGYVRGGTFTDDYVIRHIEVMGKYGNVKGDAVVDTIMPKLEITAIQMDSSFLTELFVGMQAVDAAGIVTLTRLLVIADADYHVNVAYVGATKAGKDVVIQIDNPLMEGPVNLNFESKGEVEIPCVAMGNYATVDDTVAPYQIILDETV